MASYSGSTDQLDLKPLEREDVPRRKWNILLGVCLVFAVLLLIFVILYATKKTDTATTVNTGQTGGSNTKKPPITKAPMTVPTKATPTVKTPYMDVRLPKYVVPKHYDVAVNVDLKHLKYNGTSTAEFELKQATTYVYIHANIIKITQASIRNKAGSMLQVKKTMMYQKNEFFVFEMASPVGPGSFVAQFQYEAKLTRSLKGLYKSTYKWKNGKDVTIAATQFQPTDARRVFPCFDEPALKATFSISLIHDPNYIAISNMPKMSSSNVNGLIRDNFQKTAIMPTYLLAMVVCDFKSKTVTTTTGVSMTYYAPPDQVDQLDYSVDTGKKILPYFESYYNITYPLPKADMIAIPDFAAGAMENWGLMTYRETALLFSPNKSSESNKQRVAVVVSHELAHQWFGNLVTNEWWSDLWLNEGFASYVEYFGVNHTEPSWRMMDQIVVSDQASAFRADGLVTSHPIYVPVNHPDEINEIFDSISYQKGGSILMMLDHFLGHDTFLKGLNSYLTKYQYSNAETKDLWNSLTEAFNGRLNVGQIMDTWTLQMGYPVVNITRSGSDVKLTQQRFLLAPNPDYSKEKYTSPFSYTWHIPFEYVTGTKDTNETASSPTKVWMNRTSGEIKNAPADKWIKGNPGQYGFYRVNYDAQGWMDLTSQMKVNHKVFDAKDRAGILNDAFALSGAAMLPYETALELFDYIDKDDDYIAWRAASDAITGVGSYFSKTSLGGRSYPKYILKKIDPLYKKLGFRSSSPGPDQHIETYLRTIILYRACGNGMPACLGNATSYFKKWMEDPEKNAVPADLRSLVYFYGILNGGEKEWNFAFKQYQNTTLGSERVKLLYGMAAIQEPWMIERYLNYSLDDSKVKSQDTSYVFSYIANSNPIGRYYAWYFMRRNWDTIMAKFGGGFFSMRRIFSSVTSGFKTEYELTQFDKFVKSLKNTGTATRTITQSRESIKSNIDWLARNEKTVADWLSKKV